MPASTFLRRLGLIFPVFLVRKDLSMVINCETLATDLFGRPVLFRGSNTFPGDSDKRRFDVITTAIAVLIRLRLKSSDWIMSKGRLKPGSDAEGEGKAAHQISPLCITSLPREEIWFEVFVMSDRLWTILSRRYRWVFLWPCRCGGLGGIRIWLLCRARICWCPDGGIGFQPL